MGNKKNTDIRIVRGQDRYAGSTNEDITMQIDLQGGRKNYIEEERSILINLEDRFNYERNNSNKFRIAGKITNIFNNIISGQTTYEPYTNSLYYLDAVNSVEYDGPWIGYPQYDEFSFIRYRGIEGHKPFVNKSASTYNWMTYVSYAFENVTDRYLRYTYIVSGTTAEDIEKKSLTYQVNEGVPYYIKNRKVNGKNMISFYCGIKHNLKTGDWIYTSQQISGRNTYQVYSVGDESYGNDEYVFSIFNIGYTDPQFGNNSMGTFKKVLDISNTGETISRYYIRKHKLLSNINHINMAKMGFENNAFPVDKKLEYESLTPNNTQRVSVKDGSQTVSFSFDKDINISGLTDNNNLPVSELFVTIINRGYMGWFNDPYIPTNNTGIKIGWEMNLINKSIDLDWWTYSNVNNRDNIPVDTYDINNKEFFYNKALNEGHEIMGDICEYNAFELQETVLNDLIHRYSFNNNHFLNNYGFYGGYTYKPHYPIKIRTFSNYVEFGDKDEVDLVPDYAFFSKSTNQWRWRDLYDYGFIDEDGNGTDHPFLNGCHYPFKDILFLQRPMNIDSNLLNDIIFAPISDDCE